MKPSMLAIGKRMKENTIMRKVFIFLVLPLLACLVYGAYELAQPRTGPPRNAWAYQEEQPTTDPLPPDFRPRPYKGEPVELNRGPQIVAGFQGEVHPLLHGQTKLELTAHWAAGGDRRIVKKMTPPDVVQYCLDLKPANKQQTYTERDFSAYLPEKLASVGQVWFLDPNIVAYFLRQFHPAPSMHLVGQGRRVGPDGAFAVLRAVSSSYYDIAFRVHAEFDVTPKELTGTYPPNKFWYTPAYFSGQMIVNRATGTVEYFRVGLPTDKTLNVHLTVGLRGSAGHDIVRVDRMELLGGNSELVTKEIAWEESIAYAVAHRQLQRVFYKFTEINWVPFEQAMAAARDGNKPILAIVLWGCLDDQSC